MYALSADTSTIRQRATRKAALLRERHSKTSQKTGPARRAASARSTSRSGTASGIPGPAGITKASPYDSDDKNRPSVQHCADGLLLPPRGFRMTEADSKNPEFQVVI